MSPPDEFTEDFDEKFALATNLIIQFKFNDKECELTYEYEPPSDQEDGEEEDEEWETGERYYTLEF